MQRLLCILTKFSGNRGRRPFQSLCGNWGNTFRQLLGFKGIDLSIGTMPADEGVDSLNIRFFQHAAITHLDITILRVAL